MNKINQNKDFLFTYKDDYIATLEQNSSFIPLKISEDKSFLDINFVGLTNNSPQFINEVNNECSINSLDELQSSKYFDSEYKTFNKDNLDINQIEEKKDINICIKNSIFYPSLKKGDMIEDFSNYLKLPNYDSDNSNEKNMIKNEIENENDLTNQNSGIFFNMCEKRINKIRKKIKFSVMTKNSHILKNKPNSKKIKEGEIKDKNNNYFIWEELDEKNKINKFKCEHPGCRKTFKTLKLKLNRHDISDCNCKKDTICLLYMINSTKKLLLSKKKKKRVRMKRLTKLYKKCIFSLPHKEYAINIIGNDLIN